MRPIALTCLALILAATFLAFPFSARGGYAPDHPEYPRLTSRALGMGGACVAWIDDASAIFQNPAGLGRVRSLAISHAHSRNHFPGEIENLDQLDSDPASFIVPLSGALFGYPIGSAGTGWILHGEQGYDYTRRNDESLPQERLWGMGPGDWSEGAGFHLWPGGYFGFTHRLSEYLFAEGADLPQGTNLPSGVRWGRTGEGGSAGLQQTVFPGVQFGAVLEQMIYDYQPARGDIQGERTNSLRTGWCVRPTAWLTIARDEEKLSRKEWPSRIDTKTIRVYWGAEVKVGPWFSFRWGAFDGSASRGWSYKIGPWRSDSAWVDDFMQKMITSYPPQSRSIHITGFNASN